MDLFSTGLCGTTVRIMTIICSHRFVHFTPRTSSLVYQEVWNGTNIDRPVVVELFIIIRPIIIIISICLGLYR